ncbi:P-loop containing nucleoside triphosphate hydrolase protein [Dothidotthia symphoricarpi CBS 119687]|uniref:P-loop containing nucleoside triphosphate hydrolase protein n=1 Tax=Dothidotthia symphoricarpi CBS 119687 TaxID=1392245 RepID=A0A6A6AIN1_9PLEO|nr:P-loop containing nucleoside triphosphate hydrolase protein [Dothidotthia symphoricarpi CBS 119687]KAF2130764.1 P-loop containing nucleoside triphosphate hydrolase protein [Dothidotthia symphoricarpi CBS 119687]
MLECPICSKPVKENRINEHIDSDCKDHLVEQSSSTPNPAKAHSFFAPAARKSSSQKNGNLPSSPPPTQLVERSRTPPAGTKRPLEDTAHDHTNGEPQSPPAPKRARRLKAVEDAMPLAERMRPTSLDDVCGQELVGPGGMLRGMMDEGKLPSMVLWGRPGTGKTTIARLIANTSGARFVEINSTSTKLEEVRKIFTEAARDLHLTGRKTIVFCDELHRFSKTQQDAFLGPVESGTITLIAATTENPSFKVISALLSRCRTFTLDDLKEPHLISILSRAMAAENFSSPLLDTPMLEYFARFSDGDARTALNLLDLAMTLSKHPNTTKSQIQQSLTKTLVYDRAGDQHYDSISALHKSIRGSDPDAALYYLARMLESGEDARYIARRLIVVASEDVGLADNSMLALATATYAACEKIGLPECRINLAHAVVALALAPKSTRAYRGLNNAMLALREPGVAALPIPMHLRNAPTRFMKDRGYGEGYKYNPEYVGGRVRQEYLPEGIRGRAFLEDLDLGSKVDADIVEDDELRPEMEE